MLNSEQIKELIKIVKLNSSQEFNLNGESYLVSIIPTSGKIGLEHLVDTYIMNAQGTPCVRCSGSGVEP